MDNDIYLNILGCLSERLNIVMELGEDAQGIKSFNILRNIPAEISENYRPHEKWDVNLYNCYEKDQFERLREQYVSQRAQTYTLCPLSGRIKEIVYTWFKDNMGIDKTQYTNLIHPSCQISKSVKLSEGLQMEALSSICVLSNVGFGVNIKRNCSIGHHCLIGDYVTINPSVAVSGFVKIGKGTIIGTGASIRDGISIGENCLVGMGSVVVKDIPDNSIAFGNPCKIRDTRENTQQTG